MVQQHDPQKYHGYFRLLVQTAAGRDGRPTCRAGPWRLSCTAATRKLVWACLWHAHGQDQDVSLAVCRRGEVPDPQRTRTA